jgi:hypothetical protein
MRQHEIFTLLDKMEVKRTTTIASKNVRLYTITLRLPIQDFTTRTVGDHHRYSEDEGARDITSGYIQCFKEDISCEFWVSFSPNCDDYDAEEGDLLYPRSYGFEIGAFIYEETKAFYFNVWLENENGEKFWEDKCKLDML